MKVMVGKQRMIKKKDMNLPSLMNKEKSRLLQFKKVKK